MGSGAGRAAPPSSRKARKQASCRGGRAALFGDRVRVWQVGGLHLSYDRIEVAPVTPYIGAEVGGVDLRKPSNRQFEEIHSALIEYQVLFIRDQPLDLESHM